MPRILHLFLPTDRWTRLLLVPALVFVAAATDRNYQTDLWHHLARGRVIVSEGRLLDTDRFTYTVSGQPLRDANWGWQVLFYQLYVWGGLPLVQTANSLLLAATMALLVVLAWRRCGSLIAANAACILAFLGLWQLFLIRPQTLSLFLFVILYGILEESSRRRWLLLLPPLVMALWVNVHGGFPIGLILIGCYAAAAVLFGMRDAEGGMQNERQTGFHSAFPTGMPPVRLMLCLTASVAATLANPYTWHIYEYVLLTTRAASGRHIDEWLPPGLDMLTGKVWALSLLLVLVLPALARRRLRGTEICLLCAFLPLACGSVRMVAWWLLICTPILAVQVAELWPGSKQLDAADNRPSLGNAVACGILALALVLSLPWLEAFNPFLSRSGRAHRIETDLQALADRLAADGRGGRIFTRFAWGEYLGWSLAPRYTVFMDGRIEIIPDEVWRQYNAVTRGRADWQDILSSYDVDYLILDTSGYHHDLLPLVERSPAWRWAEQYGDAVLFLRQDER